MSIANWLETQLLDKCFNAGAFAGVSTAYVKLHSSDPGEDCSSGAFGDTTRAPATFGAASGNMVSNDADVTWTNLSAGGTISHISIWDNSTGGNPYWYGALTASKTVNSGDTFKILNGDLDITLD